MVIAKNSGKDNSDKESYEVDESGERLLGEYNHLIQNTHVLETNNSKFISRLSCCRA
jgi:hypothetical protein